MLTLSGCVLPQLTCNLQGIEDLAAVDDMADVRKPDLVWLVGENTSPQQVGCRRKVLTAIEWVNPIRGHLSM